MKRKLNLADAVKKVAAFAAADPAGFASALINTIDTHSDPAAGMDGAPQADREAWALAFLASHRND